MAIAGKGFAFLQHTSCIIVYKTWRSKINAINAVKAKRIQIANQEIVAYEAEVEQWSNGESKNMLAQDLWLAEWKSLVDSPWFPPK